MRRLLAKDTERRSVGALRATLRSERVEAKRPKAVSLQTRAGRRVGANQSTKARWMRKGTILEVLAYFDLPPPERLPFFRPIFQRVTLGLFDRG